MMFILLLHPPGLGFFLPHDSKLPYSCSAQCVCVCVCVCVQNPKKSFDVAQEIYI